MPRLSQTRRDLLNSMMRESIFEATAEVLRECGLEGMTMNRVAEAASVSKSSLYDYFESKDELLAFVSERIVGPFLELLANLAAADLSAPRKLEAILRHALEDSSKHKTIFRVLAQSDQSQRLKQNARPQIMAGITSLFEQGIREGSFLPHNPAYTARMFMGCLTELFELQMSSASDGEAIEYIDILIGAVHRGFSIHAASPPASNTPRPPSSTDS